MSFACGIVRDEATRAMRTSTAWIKHTARKMPARRSRIPLMFKRRASVRLGMRQHGPAVGSQAAGVYT